MKKILQITGEARYADIMELALYNSVLSGISLNGKNFLYTNPLASSDELPFKQCWSKDRVPYLLYLLVVLQMLFALLRK